MDDLKLMSTKENLKPPPPKRQKTQKSDSIVIRKSTRNKKKVIYEEKENIEPPQKIEKSADKIQVHEEEKPEIIPGNQEIVNSMSICEFKFQILR